MRTNLRAALFALGIAAAAATAQAQPVSTPAAVEKVGPPAPAETTNAVPGVTVEATRRAPERMIPADKRAEYDAEVAKQTAFKSYRASRPQLNADSKGISDPNDMSVDYPGLHTLAPPN